MEGEINPLASIFCGDLDLRPRVVDVVTAVVDDAGVVVVVVVVIIIIEVVDGVALAALAALTSDCGVDGGVG